MSPKEIFFNGSSSSQPELIVLYSIFYLGGRRSWDLRATEACSWISKARHAKDSYFTHLEKMSDSMSPCPSDCVGSRRCGAQGWSLSKRLLFVMTSGFAITKALIK
ncbi:hypothetical protein KC322_g10 [Hortaea werneckii]|nr:hypothetical protein KC322_g10 [Hortaea werneckii]